MSEWWSYQLSDFLMFSPRTYWRLVELYNRDVWPAHVAALTAGVVAARLAITPRAWAARSMAAVLVAAWLWVGWAFHWQRYMSINWAAGYVAIGYAVQAVLLAYLALSDRQPRDRPAGTIPQRLGWVLIAAGLVAYPLAGWLAGRPWAQAEVFGIAPEPTALVTLGLLAVSGVPASNGLRWTLAVIPVLSLLLGAATLRTMAG